MAKLHPGGMKPRKWNKQYSWLEAYTDIFVWSGTPTACIKSCSPVTQPQTAVLACRAGPMRGDCFAGSAWLRGTTVHIQRASPHHAAPAR
jgi:hypothetical protein